MNKITQFTQEFLKWQKAGRPVRTQEKIVELFQICKSCENFNKDTEDKGSCNICGCTLRSGGTQLNKLRWATTKCPLEEPKWVEETVEIERAKTADVVEAKKPCGCNKS